MGHKVFDFAGVCAREEEGGGAQQQRLLQPRHSGPGPPSLPRPHLLQLPLSRLIQVTTPVLLLSISAYSQNTVGAIISVADPDPGSGAF